MNSRKKNWAVHKYVEMKQHILNQCIKEEIIKGNGKYLETKLKHNIPKITGYSESTVKRAVHTHKS